MANVWKDLWSGTLLALHSHSQKFFFNLEHENPDNPVFPSCSHEQVHDHKDTAWPPWEEGDWPFMCWAVL